MITFVATNLGSQNSYLAFSVSLICFAMEEINICLLSHLLENTGVVRNIDLPI